MKRSHRSNTSPTTSLLLVPKEIVGADQDLSAAGFLARVPALLRAARVLNAGGKVEELVEAEKVIQGTKDAEELAEAEKAAQKPDLSTNAKKGVFGEANADAYMKNQGYEKINGPDVQVGGSPKGNGIDGIYKNANPPPGYVIGEAKFGSSRLGTLKDGPSR